MIEICIKEKCLWYFISRYRLPSLEYNIQVNKIYYSFVFRDLFISVNCLKSVYIALSRIGFFNFSISQTYSLNPNTK